MVTNDEDYVSLADGFPGVQVLWVGLGNAINRVLIAYMDEGREPAWRALHAGDKAGPPAAPTARPLNRLADWSTTRPRADRSQSSDA